MSQQPIYGFPCVNNPNDFIPDVESCTPEEIETHRLACANYGKPEFKPNDGCESFYDENGKLVMHVSRTSWGIGTNLISCCDECGEPSNNLLTCHDCGPEFCEICWPVHEAKHDNNTL